MGNQKFNRVVMSDDEDEDEHRLLLSHHNDSSMMTEQLKKRRKLLLDDDEEDENNPKGKGKQQINVDEEIKQGSASKREVVAAEAAKPVSGKAKVKRKDLKETRYEIGDTVLIASEKYDQKPYVAIIKDRTIIKDTTSENVVSDMFLVQWFYRPEETEKRGGGKWESEDAREIYYSFHLDQVNALTVMHKCVVNFIPRHKEIPYKRQHRGFFVRNVYDTVQRKLFNLSDNVYEDGYKEEIDLLIGMTMSRLGDLPDIVNNYLQLPAPLSCQKDSTMQTKPKNEGKRKIVHLDDNDEEDKDQDKYENPEKVDEENEEGLALSKREEEGARAKPIDEAKIYGRGIRGSKKHFDAFEYKGIRYELEDAVLITPKEIDQEPYKAIIIDITQKNDGNLMLSVQCLYRPEEVENKDGRPWKSTMDERELFYSFNRIVVPAESVTQKIVVHFTPQVKQIPNSNQHPGFVVRMVYDPIKKRVFHLVDKDYETGKQQEINSLVNKTMSRLRERFEIDILLDQMKRGIYSSGQVCIPKRRRS